MVDTNSHTQAEFFQNSTEACTPPPRRSWSSETRYNHVSSLEFLRWRPREGPTSMCHPRDKCHACPNNTEQSWRCSHQSEERLRSHSEWSCIRPGSLAIYHLVTCHQESHSLWEQWTRRTRVVVAVKKVVVDTNSHTQAEFFQNSTEACTPPPRRSWSSETRYNHVSSLEFLRWRPREGPTSMCHPRDKCHACPNNTEQSWRCSHQSEERLRSHSEWSCIRPGSLAIYHLVTCHQESHSLWEQWRTCSGR